LDLVLAAGGRADYVTDIGETAGMRSLDEPRVATRWKRSCASMEWFVQQRHEADEVRDGTSGAAFAADFGVRLYGTPSSAAMPVIPTVRRLKAIERLSQLFQRHPRPGWNHRANFGTTRVLAVGRTEVMMSFGLHVVPPGGGAEGVFRSSVTVWPKGRKRRRREFGTWNPELLRLGWYDGCRDLLRAYGYRGTWRPSPWGRFGDFWRAHRDEASLLGEVETLESLSNERFWGRGRTPR
jgi:hypothetical protein